MADAAAAQAGAATPPPSPIAALGIVSRANEPLFFKTFVGGSDEYLRLQLASFAALDAVEERLAQRRAQAQAQSAAAKDPFLGMLLPVEEHKVFGYVTTTGVKLLLVVRDILLREDRLRELFRQLHKLYSDAVSNPFASPDAPLQAASAPRFEEAVTRALEAANAAIVYTGPLPL